MQSEKVTGFAVCVYLAKAGLEAGAIAAALGGVSPIIVSAITSYKK
jgi:hypothetical protein